MIRYADDLVVCCRTEAEAQAALKEIGRWVQAAGLTLHPTKTRIVNAAERGGFDFLGYHFEQYHGSGGTKWPRQKSQAKLRETLRGKLPRNRSGSIRQIVAEINPSLRGWHGYFKMIIPRFDAPFKSFDEFVRRRLRSAITGRTGSGWWNQKITNRMWRDLGLNCLSERHQQYQLDQAALTAR